MMDRLRVPVIWLCLVAYCSGCVIPIHATRNDSSRWKVENPSGHTVVQAEDSSTTPANNDWVADVVIADPRGPKGSGQRPPPTAGSVARGAVEAVQTTAAAAVVVVLFVPVCLYIGWQFFVMGER